MPQRLSVLAGAGGLVPEALAAARASDFEVQVLAMTPRNDLGGDAVTTDPSDIPGIASAILAFGATRLLMVGAMQVSDRSREAVARLSFNGGAPKGARSVGDVAVLSQFATALERMTGATVVGVQEIAPALLAEAGHIAGPRPDEERLLDADFAVRAAREVGRLDIGQAVVTAGHRIVGAEDIGGTDGLLRRIMQYRALGLIGDGESQLILAKALKPGQPLFVDLPAIGPATVANAAQAGVGIIAVEAGHSLLIDRPGIRVAAEAAGISVVGRAI